MQPNATVNRQKIAQLFFVRLNRLLGLFVLFLCQCGDSGNEVRLGLRVRHAVSVVFGTKLLLQFAVLTRGVGVFNQVVSEVESIPVVPERFLNHVDMMGSPPILILLDEPSVERGIAIISRGSPEEVIPLGFKDGSNSFSGLLQIRHLDQDVHNRFRA